MKRRPPWLKRSAAAALAAAFGVSAGHQAQAATWQANDDDALVLELRSGQYRLGDTLRGYQTSSGVCVDLADLIQSMNLPVRLDKKSRRATGWIFSETETFVIDRDSSMVQTMNNRRALSESDLYDTPEGWCADLGALSSWFGITFRSDLSNLAVVIESQRKLPFLEAIERKSRAARLRPSVTGFDLAQMPQAELPYKSWRAPSVDVLLSSNWRKSAGGAGAAHEFRYEAYASGEVLGASFDARLTSSSGFVPDSLRLKAYRVDPEGELLGSLKATQIAAGDVESFAGALTGQSAVGRGIFITNRPITRSSRFAVTTLRGDMPSGWDAELYRNGQLIAFQASPSDGRYEFPDVELRFGENSFEVVLYGPQGQIRSHRSSYPVGNDSLPVGKTLYWAGILEQGKNLVDFGRGIVNPLTGWRWGVGVERGIDKRTTAGLGMQSLMIKGMRHNYLEATLRRGIGPLLVELAGAQEFGRNSGRAYEAQAIGRIGRFNIKAEAFWIDGGYESEVISADESQSYALSADTEVKIGGLRVPIQAGRRQTITRDGTRVNEWLTRSSLVMRKLSLTAELAWRESSGPKADKANNGLRLNLLANTVIGSVRLRGNGKYRLSGPNAGLESVTVTGEKSLGPRSDIKGSVEYKADNREMNFGLGLVRQFDKFSLRADASASNRGAFGLGLSLAMSFGPDPVSGGMRMSANKLAQYGEARVTVFRDDNGDGIRQFGEEPVAGVEIAAGNGHDHAQTNASGQALIEGLRPFTQVLVNIDESSIDDPLLLPKGKGVVVVPRPGIAADVELALAPTGEVEGTLLGTDGERREGVMIELADLRGQVIARAQSEYDGYFLFDRVPYGDYRLRIAAPSATALGVRAEIAGAWRIDRNQPSLRAGLLRLEPLAQPGSITEPGQTIAARK